MRHFAAPDGAKIAYEVEGSGRPLVLLHGLMAHRGFFRFQSALASDFQLISVDLRGHGQSVRAGDATRVEQLAADVAALVDQLALEDAIGVGWSLGATVLWHLLTGPAADRFGGAVVIDMTPKVQNGDDWELGLSRDLCDARSAAIRDDFENFAAGAGHAIFAQPLDERSRDIAAWSAAEFVRNDAASISAVWGSLVEQDLRARLGRIRQPTLIVHGAQSQLYGSDTAEYLAGALPNAQTIRFDGSGHAPHMEQPELFNDAIRQFAASLPRVREAPDIALNRRNIMARIPLSTALRLGTALIALTASGAAFAQSGQQLPAEGASEEQQAAAINDVIADDGVAQDQEIIVTARRRAESLQDVPIAVTAYTGEALERQGAIDLTDISDTTPNVTLETSRGTNTTLTAFIRGVGQQDPVAGFESGVGLYLDDVFLNRPQAAVLDIYDVERIEVLRGPQGTLYGRNTIGGAIKYVTRRLSDDPMLKARATLGTYEQADLVVTGSLPMGDYLKMGASIARLSRGGFGENLTTGRENYNKDVWAARGTVEIEPSADIFVRFSGDVTKDRSEPRGGHRTIPGFISGAPILDDVYDTRGALVAPKQDIQAWGLAMHADAQLTDAVTFRSITSYRKDRSATPIDFDALPAADVDVPAIYKNKQFSQELQLLYEQGPLSGLLGAYYLDANANNIFDVLLATTGAVIGLPGFTASTYGDVTTRTWALFGDFTYRLSDQFSLSLGGRYTNDKRDAVVIKRNLIGGVSPALGGAGVQVGGLVSDFQGGKTFKEFTPRASLTFEPNDDNTFYATYSKGFKGGGFDPRANSPQAGDSDGDGDVDADDIFEFFLFDPETVNSYELGYKASLFDRRLRLAIAGFYADYKNVQVPGSQGCVVGGIPTFCGVTTNAGAASFKGVETEIFANLARMADGSRVNFTGTIGYLDAQYDEFITNIPAGFADDGSTNQATTARPVDVAAYRNIQNTPKWTLSGTLDYSTPVGEGELTAATTVSYRSKTYQFEVPNALLDQRGYALWDASVVWSSAGDRFTIGLHAKNILDKQYITSGYPFLVANPVTGDFILSATRTAATFNQPGLAPALGREGVATAFYGNPRQVFATFGVKF